MESVVIWMILAGLILVLFGFPLILWKPQLAFVSLGLGFLVVLSAWVTLPPDDDKLMDKLGEQERLARVITVNANEFCVVLAGEKEVLCTKSNRVFNLAFYGNGESPNPIDARPGDEYYVSKTDFAGKDMALLSWVRR